VVVAHSASALFLPAGARCAAGSPPRVPRRVSGGCKNWQLWRAKIWQSAARSGCRLRAWLPAG